MSDSLIAETLNDFYNSDLKLGSDGSKYFLLQTSLTRFEVESLIRIVKEFKPERTLEVGLALAASAIGITLAKRNNGQTAPHVCLDPFQDSGAKNSGLLEIERLGLSKFINHLPLYSEDYLNECNTKGRKFDFIFIDGSHTIGQAVTDAFLSDKVLSSRGIIVIHDSLLFSTSASIKYLIYEKGYHLVNERVFNFRTFFRILKYSINIGLFYSFEVIPRISGSLVILQKP